MKNVIRLKKIIKIVEKQTEQALYKFQQAKAEYDALHAQLDNLYTYQSEYMTNFKNNAGQGISGMSYRQFSAFIDKLETVICQQRQTINAQEQNLSLLRKHWQQLDARTQGLLKLVDKYEKQNMQIVEKQNQKISDEQANCYFKRE